MSAPVMLICARTSDPPGPSVVGKLRCDECNRQVWASPATIAVFKSPPPEGAIVACIECSAKLALRRTLETGEPMEIGVTAQHEIEMLTHTGLTATEAWLKLGVSPSRIKRIK